LFALASAGAICYHAGYVETFEKYRATKYGEGAAAMGLAFRKTGEFSASDFLREAAERSMHVTVQHAAMTHVDAPMMRGTVVAEDIQPGLTVAAHDLVYLCDGSYEAEVERSLMCALLVEGETEPMLLPRRSPIEHVVGEVALIGFSAPTHCMRHYRTGQRNRAFALTIKPTFFERFEGDVSDAGLAAFRGLIDPGADEVIRQPPLVLAALAGELFHPSYGGELGRLYQESLALRFIVEASARMRDKACFGRLLGRRRAQRLRDARDILDNSLTHPPKTLDLARMVGTNVTSLQREFKQAFGTTIFGYIRARRLAMAHILIVEHGLGIAEAGYRVGFTNAAAFTAAYRRHFGHPPSRRERWPRTGSAAGANCGCDERIQRIETSNVSIASALASPATRHGPLTTDG
jgi:AraC-like DNA-binding protein